MMNYPAEMSEIDMSLWFRIKADLLQDQRTSLKGYMSEILGVNQP